MILIKYTQKEFINYTINIFLKIKFYQDEIQHRICFTIW